MKKGSVFLLLTTLIFACSPLARSEELSAQAEAGKLIYDAVTHRVGCVGCHAPDGTARAEGKRYTAEKSIQGRTADDIRLAIMALPMMWKVKLTDEELEQVAAYLAYLQNTSN